MNKIITQTYHRDNAEVNENYSTVVKSTSEEILYQIQRRFGKPISRLSLLDIGSGLGEYAFELEKYFKKVVGVEPYTPVFRSAISKKKKIKSKVKFVNVKIENFHTKEKFHFIISLTSIEHMSDAYKSFNKIFSLMPKGGILYLTAPNKWWPFENHYRLFFLSWLPLPLANLYVRFFHKGSSYEDSAYSKSYSGMKKFLDRFPCKYEFVLPRSANAVFLGCGDKSKLYCFVRKIGVELIRAFPFFWIFSKGFIIIATKR